MLQTKSNQIAGSTRPDGMNEWVTILVALQRFSYQSNNASRDDSPRKKLH